MTTTKTVKVDKKEKLLEQLKEIQSKIDSLEKHRAEKIMKLAKKFSLFDLSDKIIESEFSLIKSKYDAKHENAHAMDHGKKN